MHEGTSKSSASRQSGSKLHALQTLRDSFGRWRKTARQRLECVQLAAAVTGPGVEGGARKQASCIRAAVLPSDPFPTAASSSVPKPRSTAFAGARFTACPRSGRRCPLPRPVRPHSVKHRPGGRGVAVGEGGGAGLAFEPRGQHLDLGRRDNTVRCLAASGPSAFVIAIRPLPLVTVRTMTFFLSKIGPRGLWPGAGFWQNDPRSEPPARQPAEPTNLGAKTTAASQCRPNRANAI